MRARRAGTAVARTGGILSPAANRGAPPLARRRWQQRYRCLRRAQPGVASKRQTRPNPAVPAPAD